MKLNQIQNQKVENFYENLSKIIPQRKTAPQWFISLLSLIIPHRCIFERTIFFNGILILYIPQLCRLNPFFNLILEHRLNSYLE